MCAASFCGNWQNADDLIVRDALWARQNQSCSVFFVTDDMELEHRALKFRKAGACEAIPCSAFSPLLVPDASATPEAYQERGQDRRWDASRLVSLLESGIDGFDELPSNTFIDHYVSWANTLAPQRGRNVDPPRLPAIPKRRARRLRKKSTGEPKLSRRLRKKTKDVEARFQ